MKRSIGFLVLLLAAGSALADHYVSGHTRKDGTYVRGHTASDPDQYRNNNRSSETQGGNRCDGYSSDGATNKSNSGYGHYDDDRDGVYNPYDRNPESKKSSW